jgi:hypothetical protein
MCLLSLTATCQLCSVSLKAGQSTYKGMQATAYVPLQLPAAPDAQRCRAQKAWRLVPGERPCGVRASHPAVSSLASRAAASGRPRRTRGAKRRPSILEAVGGTAPPEGLVLRRQTRVADAEGGHAHRRLPTSSRGGEAAQGHRRPQAAAGRTRDATARGRPHRHRLREHGPSGSMRGAPGHRCPYRGGSILHCRG